MKTLGKVIPGIFVGIILLYYNHDWSGGTGRSGDIEI